METSHQQPAASNTSPRRRITHQHNDYAIQCGYQPPSYAETLRDSNTVAVGQPSLYNKQTLITHHSNRLLTTVQRWLRSCTRHTLPTLGYKSSWPRPLKLLAAGRMFALPRLRSAALLLGGILIVVLCAVAGNSSVSLHNVNLILQDPLFVSPPLSSPLLDDLSSVDVRVLCNLTSMDMVLSVPNADKSTQHGSAAYSYAPTLLTSMLTGSEVSIQQYVNHVLRPWQQFAHETHLKTGADGKVVSALHLTEFLRASPSHRLARFRWSRCAESVNAAGTSISSLQAGSEQCKQLALHKPKLEWVVNECVGQFSYHREEVLPYRLKLVAQLLQLYLDVTPLDDIPVYMDLVVSVEMSFTLQSYESKHIRSGAISQSVRLDEHMISESEPARQTQVLPAPVFGMIISSHSHELPFPALSGVDGSSSIQRWHLNLTDFQSQSCGLARAYHQYLHRLLTTYSRLLITPWSTAGRAVTDMIQQKNYVLRTDCDLQQCYSVCCCHPCVPPDVPFDNQLAFPHPMGAAKLELMRPDKLQSHVSIPATRLVDEQLDILAYAAVKQQQQYGWQSIYSSNSSLTPYWQSTSHIQSLLQSHATTQLTSAPPPLPLLPIGTRVAMLFTGNARSFSSTFTWTMYHVIANSPFPVDLFFHIWSDSDAWTVEVTLKAFNAWDMVKGFVIEEPPPVPVTLIDAQRCHLDVGQTPGVWPIQSESLRRVNRLKRAEEWRLRTKYVWVVRTRMDQEFRQNFWPMVLQAAAEASHIPNGAAVEPACPTPPPGREYAEGGGCRGYTLARPIDQWTAPQQDLDWSAAASLVPPTQTSVLIIPTCGHFKGYNDQFAIGSSDAIHLYSERPLWVQRCTGWAGHLDVGFNSENCQRKYLDNGRAAYRVRLLALPICYRILRPAGFVNTWADVGVTNPQCQVVWFYGTDCCKDACRRTTPVTPSCLPDFALDDPSSSQARCLPTETAMQCSLRRNVTAAC